MINSYIELAHEDDIINKVTFSKTFSHIKNVKRAIEGNR
jgi:hypothetical protein